MNDSTDNGLKTLLKIVFIFTMSIMSTLFYSWIFMTIWGWYGVIAAGLPVLPYITWLGFSLLISVVQVFVIDSKAFKSVETTSTSEWLTLVAIKMLAALYILGIAGLLFVILL